MECATSNNPSWCDFCIALETYNNIGMTPEYIKLSNDAGLNREIMKTDNFRVMVALGPVVVGNLLIVTNDHFTSMAQLDNGGIEELMAIKDKIKAFLSSTGLQVAFFEHGISKDEDADGCISHAHLQVLPIEKDLLTHVQEQYEGFQISDYRQLRMLNLDGYKGYLHYETISGSNWIFPVNTLESQYIRKLATRFLGVANQWNWRLHPRIDVIQETIKLFEGKF